MGLGDLTNSLLGGAEDLYDAGKEKLGEGVDWATDKLGEGLDKVGAHDWADSVEDWGDEVASDLGATPGEQQLGQTEEANELVHGNPDKIRESAKHLKDFHGAFDKVNAGLKKVDSSGWLGEGGDAFREKFGVHPAKWAQASEACEAAAGALESYAGTVKWAQGQAKEAVELYKKGVKASKDAADAYNEKVDAYNARIKANEDPGPRPEPFKDPGKADVKAAAEKLAEARKQRNTAASEAQGRVKAALTHAPAEPPPLERLGNDFADGYQAVNTELTHVVGGALKGTAGLLNFVRGLNPTDPYNLTHPAAYLQNVNMTLAGLVSTASHPERVVQAAVDGFKKDPSEFVGRLIPELIGTKGAGLARGGLRLAAKEGLESAAQRGVREGLERQAARGAGDPMPERADVMQALRDSKPEVVKKDWPDTDGRYYADRVLAGGRADGEKVFAGHGYLTRNAGDVVVPEGTNISFYVQHGDPLPGLNGLTVERGVYPGGYVETFGPGDVIPNYTLGPPAPMGGGGFSVFENSTTVGQRATLQDLLEPGMGNVHWAACREIK
ncbi:MULTISPECIES: putative T7SS-secreted protein [unclassified Streptomyces]|uniref:putative T7SS-secreted protein n=1 Tax=Streptomyces sp. NBC_00723 TaxID=2903673 RepID=UPI003867FC0D